MRRSPRRAARVVTAVAALVLTGSATGTAAAAPGPPAAPDLGPQVVVFDPSMPVAEIQATVDAINAQQIDAEMGTGR